MTKRDWVLMGALAALWGASYALIKVAIDGGLSDTFIVFARTLLGAAVLWPVLLRTGALPAVRRRFGWLALISVAQIVGPFLLITWGEHHVPSSLAGILVASAPIWAALIALTVVRTERMQGAGLAGVALGIVGVGLLFGVDLHGDDDALLGGAGILLAGLGYAIAGFVAKAKCADVPPVGVAGTIIGLSALIMLPTVPFGAPTETPNAGTIAALVLLGAGGTGAAFLVFYMLNAQVGPTRSAVVAYIAPGFSVFYGVAFMDEAFTLGTAAGLVLILLGSWMAAAGRTPGRRRRDQTATEATAGGPLAKTPA
ncbi:MAG TPA: DMT family transporter [Solirubrobacteraceae bacterium]|nr:DMT family transporter [Solirubrobacteraceae bacterium]